MLKNFNSSRNLLKLSKKLLKAGLQKSQNTKQILTARNATMKIAIKERLRSAKLNPSRIDWAVIDPTHCVIRKMKKRSVA